MSKEMARSYNRETKQGFPGGIQAAFGVWHVLQTTKGRGRIPMADEQRRSVVPGSTFRIQSSTFPFSGYTVSEVEQRGKYTGPDITSIKIGHQQKQFLHAGRNSILTRGNQAD